MICITDELDTRDGILFKKWVRLSSGIRGKLIELPNCLNTYMITENAEVYSILTEMRLKPYVGNNGYYRVNLAGGDRHHYKTMSLHRLMGFAFIPNPNKYPIINHLNGNRLDLSLSNLEWTTYSGNNLHAIHILNKRQYVPEPENCNLTTHTPEEVRMVCELLEKGYSPRQIDNKYHVGYWFIIALIRGNTWKKITKDYKIPRMKRSYKHFTAFQVEEISNLILEGYMPKEICQKMGLEYNDIIRGSIKHLKHKILSSEAQDKPL